MSKNILKILVTGANGQLGKSIRNCCEGLTDNYIFTDIEELDITDVEAVEEFILSQDIDIIINCAAYTNVDKAEDFPEAALKLNATAVRNLAESIRKKGGHLIHVSTDYVFGGDPVAKPKVEDDPTSPLGVYGMTKLEGEKEIAKSGVKSLIFRTAWLYSEYGKNFLKTMLSLTAERDELKVVFDQCGTPTNAGDLARAICDIVERRQYEGKEGIYHYSNEGVCSWFDFARTIGKMAGHKHCKVLPCHSSEFPSKVERPPYSVLDKTKYKTTFGVNVPYWTDSLEKTIKNLLK